MRVSYIILNYKTWKETVREIEQIAGLLNLKMQDIIVVDNASPNDSSEMLEAYAKKTGIIFLKENENKGYAAGNNVGLRYSFEKGYDYAWILNNDILIEDSEILTKMLEVFDKDKMIAVVNPDVYTPDGRLCNRNSKRGNLWTATLGMLKFRNDSFKVADNGGYGIIYRPQGCCMLVDLKKLDEIDYLDENTFLYVEEPILAERLLRKNYKCACALDTKVIHNHSTTVKSSLQRRKINQIKCQSNAYFLKTYRGYGKIRIFLCNFFMILRHELSELR